MNVWMQIMQNYCTCLISMAAMQNMAEKTNQPTRQNAYTRQWGCWRAAKRKDLLPCSSHLVQVIKTSLGQYSKLKIFPALFLGQKSQEKVAGSSQCWNPGGLLLPSFRTKTSNPLLFHFPLSRSVHKTVPSGKQVNIWLFNLHLQKLSWRHHEVQGKHFNR